MKNYEQKIANLRMRKLAQTQEKIEKEGLLDEDDYGRGGSSGKFVEYHT